MTLVIGIYGQALWVLPPGNLQNRVCGSGMYIMTLDFTEVNSHRARERGEGDEKSLVCTVPYAKSKQDERTSPFLME